ncbi:LamG-like jellyroll fold domain-containing protein [Rosistilla oblonga]|uniref:FecR protein n=1 Tax=Rosistilla oblonga TaxID=2527990 RepID=A0A518IMZ1_9BACT|nr:LamG-like jellyroll fold domain-containing protein [Rosistilla oblonga]QDV54453.1 FecR protein [Rosistilla oblonga]
MTPEERERLIDSLIDGEIDEADFLRIEAEMSVDPEVRALYYNRLKLDLLLQREARGGVGDSESGVAQVVAPAAALSPAAPVNILQRRLTGIFAVLAATVLGFVAWSVWNPDSSRLGSPAGLAGKLEPTAAGFAILHGQSDAVWEGDPLATGSLVPSGPLRLLSGVAQIELFSGVRMVIEGDAQFVVQSAMLVQLDRGRARAQVPEAARGFRVQTRHGDLIDLGTEFAIDASDEAARVEVLTGEVELHGQGAAPQRVLEGDAWQLSEAGVSERSDSDSLQVIGPDAFERQLSSQQVDQRRQWQQRVASMRDDDRLIAWYQTQQTSTDGRQLPNLAESDSQTAGAAAIVACQPSSDRWGQAGGALDLSRTGSRVRIDVPGEFGSLTMMCWVKIHSLDRLYNSLFLTDGHELQEPHWQIMNDGRLFFSVKKFDGAEGKRRRPDKYNFYSPPFWDASLSGQWIMLATTYDVQARRVSHYFNGEEIGSEAIPADYLVPRVTIGPASIGNWSEPMYRTDPQFVVRNLNGSLDEFVLYSSALSGSEIAELYRLGNPAR